MKFAVCIFFISIAIFLLPQRTPFAQVVELKISEKRVLEGFKDYVREVRFSPFGSYIAVTAGDNTVTLYNKNLGMLWTHQGDRKSVGGKTSFSPDEKYMAFTRFRSIGDIGILKIDELKVVQALDAHSYYVNSVAWSPDGTLLASAGADYKVAVWRWNGKEFSDKQVLGDHKEQVNEAVFSPDGAYLVSAGNDKTIIVWKDLNGKFVKHKELAPDTYWFESLAYSPDGCTLVSGTSDKITFWTVSSDAFTIAQSIEHSSGRVWSLEFSPDGEFLAGAFSNATVKIWHRQGGEWKEVHIIYRHRDNVFDASFSPDGALLATASSDQTAIFWDVKGIKPDPVIQLMGYTGLSFTAAQKLVLDRISAGTIVRELDAGLGAPRDEFETMEEYKRRLRALGGAALLKIQELMEKKFGIASEKRGEGRFDITLKLDELQSYNPDEQNYTVKVLGTKGQIGIPVEEAKTLKQNRENARLKAVKELSQDGVSYNYSGFELIHPLSGKTYAVALEENPFRGIKTMPVGRAGGEPEPEPAAVVRGPDLELENVEFGAVFPVFYKFYDETPIGRATLRNSGTVPLESIRVELFIKQYMDNPKQCRAPAKLEVGEKKDVQLFGLFTDKVLEISEGNKVSVRISVNYTAEKKSFSKEYIHTIRLENRNAVTWDDDRKAAAFVTAKDPAVLKFSKNVAGMIKGKASRSLNQNLLMAMGMFEALGAYGLNYVVDPITPYREFSQNKIAVDFLQFPKQTLEYKAGDCDDLSILFNALLESVGIKSAFITIPGHIYSAFSLDLTPEEARRQFESERDFITIGDTVWMPLELTLLDQGFLRAWQAGAQQWQDFVARKQAAFYRTESAWEVYEPVGFAGGADVSVPVGEKVLDRYLKEIDSLIQKEIGSREKELKLQIEKTGGSPELRNRLGVLYARFGLDKRAVEEFEMILKTREFAPALINLGNIYYLGGDIDRALSCYERAFKAEPANPAILKSLVRAYEKKGDQEAASGAYLKLKSAAPEQAREFDYYERKPGTERRAGYAGHGKEEISWSE